MRGILSLVTLVSLLVSQLSGMKILMAGEFEKGRRDWYLSVANKLASNDSTDNQVYFLTTALAVGEEQVIDERLIKFGIGDSQTFEWDLAEIEEQNTRQLDLNSAKAYFLQESLLQDLRSKNFTIGVGGMNFADTLLFRELDIPYLKLSEEDIEGYTMQRRLNMPVLTSSYPSRQVWSRFHHSEIPLVGTLAYRWTNYKVYFANLWENYSLRNEMHSIVGPSRRHIIDDWDQEHAMIIGQGTRAGLYQSIMMKPPNIRYVYPLTMDRTEIQVPSYLQEHSGLVVFNIEANRGDDLMRKFDQFVSLRLLISDMIVKGYGIIILAPSKVSNKISEHFSEDIDKSIWLIQTEYPHDLKVVNPSNSEQNLVWVSSCTQANIISAVGEHSAIMVGYAYGQTQVDTSVQKFNCHKINEHVVGTSSRLEGEVSTLSINLFDSLVNKTSVQKDVMERVNFYHELLNEEKSKTEIDLEYWLDYTVLFGVEHKIPLYDKMSTIQYLNIEVWSLFALCMMAVLVVIKKILITVGLVCGCCKKKEEASKAEGKVKDE